jgi:hypothetical protein
VRLPCSRRLFLHLFCRIWRGGDSIRNVEVEVSEKKNVEVEAGVDLAAGPCPAAGLFPEARARLADRRQPALVGAGAPEEARAGEMCLISPDNDVDNERYTTILHLIVRFSFCK